MAVALSLGACGGESEKNASDGSVTVGSGGASSSSTTGLTQTSNGATTMAAVMTATSGSVTNGVGATTTGSASGGTAGMTSAGGSGGSGGTDAGPGGAAGAGGGPTECEPQDVRGVGNCDAAFGVYFLGGSCGWVSGCSCEGSDCGNAHADEAACEQAHRGCLDDCRPQDATFIGDCDPVSRHVFNGTECVAQVGCACEGDDCDATYATSKDCTEAHATCQGRATSCDELAVLYDEYVSRRACQSDLDCTMVFGDCGLGGCYHAVNRHWGQAGLSSLMSAWAQGACGGPVCDCAPPPDEALCDAGVCVPGPI